MELKSAEVVSTLESVPQPEAGARDRECIEAFLAGDRSAFDRLVARYMDRTFNLCCRYLGDPEDANDCAQEVFVKVYQSLKKFRFESSFSTWLYTITVNTCKNRLKSAEYRYRKRMVPIAAPGGDEGSDGRSPSGGRSGAVGELEDPAPSPLAELTRMESEALVARAISTLPHDARAVLVLRDVEGLSYEEIAGVTGYNIGTVKSKLARARQQLREKLRGAV